MKELLLSHKQIYGISTQNKGINKVSCSIIRIITDFRRLSFYITQIIYVTKMTSDYNLLKPHDDQLYINTRSSFTRRPSTQSTSLELVVRDSYHKNAHRAHWFPSNNYNFGSKDICLYNTSVIHFSSRSPYIFIIRVLFT